ncbi:MAG: hypothetical protein HY776_08180, partial [Actinobacteria bacterium]|nr:hypothetical protein [Actinomycetota bacterium]
MIKKAMRRFLKDRMTSFLIVLIVFSILIQAIPANAIDLRISNDALANEALSHPIGSDGGTCKEFVKHVFNSVAAAVGSSLRIGSGYRACYLNAGGVEVSGSDAVRGDFIQINKDSDPKNYYSGMHSAIVLENYHNGSFLVIDSNWNWDEKVRTHTWNPTAYAISKGLSAHFYRLGTIAPPTPAYAWQFISQTASKDLVGLSPGETVTVTLTAKNVGSATWYKSGANPVRVGTTNPRERPSTFANSTWLGSNRPTGLPVDQVKQGETVTFSWTITAPSTPGEYREHYSLVAEGIAWMNDPGINYYIVVNNRSYDYDEHYYVWRDADQALNRSVGIVAQSFKAKFPLIKSVSFNGANVSGGKVYVKIFSNEGQTQQVGSTKEVIVNNYGETTAIWDEPIPVNVGNTYWLQILPPEGTKMTIYFSKYNEYSEGSLYLDWTKESSYDLNSSVRGYPNPSRSYDYDEHYYVWRDADQALNRSVGIVAQSFKAKFPLIKSV